MATLLRATSSQPDLRIHYLGHAAFILYFGNGVTVLTDYGTSNAYGLASPIHAIGSFCPTVVTYSHSDPDHFRGCHFEGAHMLTGKDHLEIEELTIEPVLTTERKTHDNTSYVFTYKGLTVVHLGDAQGDISQIAQPKVQEDLRGLFAGDLDLLLLPIGWTRDLTQEAAACADLLCPRHLIPMHYWNPQDKTAFLQRLAARQASNGQGYRIVDEGGSHYALSAHDPAPDAITVISLEPKGL